METIDAKVLPKLTLILGASTLIFENIMTGVSHPATFMSLDGVFGIDIAQKGVLRIDYCTGRFDLSFPELREQN
jgi:hypothetical protein